MDLFFTVSKATAFFLLPTNFIVLLLLVAAGLAAFRRTRRWGIRTGLSAGALFMIIAVLPIGPLLIRSLEQRFPALEACPSVLREPLAGIILLGGGVNPAPVNGRVVDDLNDASDRVWLAADLARRFPHLPLVISGGQAFDNGIKRPEAGATASLLERLGVPREQMVLERASRTTAENAALSARNVGEGRWLIVTSAFHMPRAIGTFRQAGISAIAAPTDWRVQDQGPAFRLDAAANVAMMNLATKEYLGLFGYWITGRSSELMPGPKTDECEPKPATL